MKIRLEHITLDDLYMRAIPVFLRQMLGESVIDLNRDEATASFDKNVG
jgi:hypothetical protein